MKDEKSKISRDTAPLIDSSTSIAELMDCVTSSFLILGDAGSGFEPRTTATEVRCSVH